MLKNVRHVPLITKSLIRTRIVDDAGYVTNFGNNAWKISKGSMTIAHGDKFGTLYMLHVFEVKHNVINVTEQPSVSLWHCQLGHMPKKGMDILSHFGYFLGFSFKILNFMSIVFMGNKHKNHIEKWGIIKMNG